MEDKKDPVFEGKAIAPAALRLLGIVGAKGTKVDTTPSKDDLSFIVFDEETDIFNHADDSQGESEDTQDPYQAKPASRSRYSEKLPTMHKTMSLLKELRKEQQTRVKKERFDDEGNNMALPDFDEFTHLVETMKNGPAKAIKKILTDADESSSIPQRELIDDFTPFPASGALFSIECYNENIPTNISQPRGPWTIEEKARGKEVRKAKKEIKAQRKALGPSGSLPPTGPRFPFEPTNEPFPVIKKEEMNDSTPIPNSNFFFSLEPKDESSPAVKEESMNDFKPLLQSEPLFLFNANVNNIERDISQLGKSRNTGEKRRRRVPRKSKKAQHRYLMNAPNREAAQIQKAAHEARVEDWVMTPSWPAQVEKLLAKGRTT